MKADCDCDYVHGPAERPDMTDLGVDMRNGRFGRVALHRCTACGGQWLHYLVEYEAFSDSGRWFCGRVDDATAAAISAENAIGALAGLPWYWAGGSYFGGEVAKASGPVPVDVYGPPAVE
jgi:hypothetical protein